MPKLKNNRSAGQIMIRKGDRVNGGYSAPYSPDYSAYYWSGFTGRFSHEEWQKAARLFERYRRYRHYAQEISPGWREVDKTLWADNSIESNQVCKCGQHTRRVMLAPPSGDRCF